MNKGTIIQIAVTSFLVASAAGIVLFLCSFGQQMEPSLACRFKWFIGIHAYQIVAVALQRRVEENSHLIACVYSLFFVPLAMTVCSEVFSRQYSSLSPSSLSKAAQQFPFGAVIWGYYQFVGVWSLIATFLILLDQCIDFMPLLDRERDSEQPLEDNFATDVFARQLKGESCPICLMMFEPAQPIKQIKKCGHFFHAQCLNDWLKHSRTCPLDRGDLF